MESASRALVANLNMVARASGSQASQAEWEMSLAWDSPHCKRRAAPGSTSDMLQNQRGNLGAPPIKSVLNPVVATYTKHPESEAKKDRAAFCSNCISGPTRIHPAVSAPQLVSVSTQHSPGFFLWVAFIEN